MHHRDRPSRLRPVSRSISAKETTVAAAVPSGRKPIFFFFLASSFAPSYDYY